LPSIITNHRRQWFPIICEYGTFHVGNLRDAKNRPPATGIASRLRGRRGLRGDLAGTIQFVGARPVPDAAAERGFHPGPLDATESFRRRWLAAKV
jgi:hypothetical protein